MRRSKMLEASSRESMRLLGHAAVALLCALLFACGHPVPAEKSAYVGAWAASEMRLVITREGYVEYERRRGQAATSISAPLQGFDGDNFYVGVGPLRTTFVVTKPPYRDGATWKMVVDGVELSKRIEGDDGPGDRALERGRVLASATDSLSLRAPESGPVPQTSQPYAAFS